MVVLPVLVVFIVLNSSGKYTAGLLRTVCLIPSFCYLIICFSSRSSLLSLFSGLCIVVTVGKFLSPPVRSPFAKLYLSFLSPFTYLL